MIIDSGKIERIWQDFASNNGLDLDDSEKNYGHAKKKSYTVIEKHGEHLIRYEYKFYPSAQTNVYPFDLIKKANRFVISSASKFLSDIDLKICKSSWIRRLNYGDKFVVRSSKQIEFDNVLKDKLSNTLKDFPDLTVEISPDFDSLDKQNNLMMLTHNLPGELEEIESLRELFILIHGYFID